MSSAQLPWSSAPDPLHNCNILQLLFDTKTSVLVKRANLITCCQCIFFRPCLFQTLPNLWRARPKLEPLPRHSLQSQLNLNLCQVEKSTVLRSRTDLSSRPKRHVPHASVAQVHPTNSIQRLPIFGSRPTQTAKEINKIMIKSTAFSEISKQTHLPFENFIQRSLKVKLRTMWRDEKQRWEESERREMSRREKEKESEEEGEEDTGVRNVGKFAKLYVCPMICRSTPCSDPFWKFGCLRIARRCGAKHMSKSKCAKQTMSDSCLKITRRCGAKHMSKSKCAKHTRLRPFLEDQMPKQKVK